MSVRPASGFCAVHGPGAGATAVAPPGPTPAAGGRTCGSAWDARGQAAAVWYAAADGFVAFHGNVSGLETLRRDLGLAADAAAGAVLLAARRRWSVQFLARLDGPFVAVLGDGDEVLMYRDPSGLRNLYWCSDPVRGLGFATHLGTLVERLGWRPEVNRSALHEYLHFLDIAAPATFYDGLQALEAGQLLRWTPLGVTPLAPPDAGAANDDPADFEAGLDRLDDCLGRSIEGGLANAYRPAAFLSSGVDSSLLCALAARRQPRTIALTVGFDGAAFDEAPAAARVAAHLGLRHEVLRFGRAGLVAAFERLGATLDQPMADPSTPATVLALEHCRDHHDAVLDGTGADEAVGAWPPRHQRLAVAYGSLVPGPLRRALRAGLVRSRRLAGHAPLIDFEHPADALKRWHGFTRAEIESLCGEAVSFGGTSFYRTFARFPRRAHFERYSALIETMPCERLTQAEQTTGVALRYPFCSRDTDRLLRRFRTTFPPTPERPKHVLRALLARHVPPALWEAPKRGFTFPLHAFLAGDDHALVRRHLDPARWRAGGLVAPAGVDRVARRYIAGDAALAFRVWALIVLRAWLDEHESR